MIKVLVVGITIWAVVIMIRVWMIGGLDSSYRDPEIDIFRSYQFYLSETINQILPSPQSALLSGIILGQRENLPYFLKQDLQRTSTIHMVVVSGQNLTILAGFIMGLCATLGRKKTIGITLGTIFLYALLTGFQIPVIRAAIMASLTFVGQILGREVVGWWVLVLTTGLMLLVNPNWLLSISFQLSVLATFGVIVVAPILKELFKKIPKLINQDLSVSLGAQLMVMPIIAANFGTISISGILSNLLILWSIPIIMITGFFSMMVGLVSLELGRILALVPSVLLTYFVYVVELTARLPLSQIFVEDLGMVTWLGYYFILFGALISLAHWGRKKRSAPGLT